MKDNDVVLVLLGVWAAFFVSITFIATKMFEYSFYTIFGKDIPWYLDLLGAVVLNGAGFVIFVICAIIRACGIDIPLVEV